MLTSLSKSDSFTPILNWVWGKNTFGSANLISFAASTTTTNELFNLDAGTLNAYGNFSNFEKSPPDNWDDKPPYICSIDIPSGKLPSTEKFTVEFNKTSSDNSPILFCPNPNIPFETILVP